MDSDMRAYSLAVMATAICLLTAGCRSNDYLGSSHNNFAGFPKRPVSVHQAVRKAHPHLSKTFELRLERCYRARKTNRPEIWVTLKDHHYHIVLDSCVNYDRGFYLEHAVKVHTVTGEVTPPK